MSDRTITREEIQKLIEDGNPPVLVETLRTEHFEQGHLPGAIHIHFEAVNDLAPVLLPDKDAAIVTYCSNLACRNSGIAQAQLEALGYTDVRKYGEGKEDWETAGLPLESGSRFTARQPEDVDYMLARAFNANDLEAASRLYEDGASVRRLADQGGTIATGDEGIREAMSYYIGLEPHMDIVVHHVTRSGPLALLRSQWEISGRVDGEEVVLSHHGIEVVREQEDGSWKMVIDHPYAADAEWAVEELPPLAPLGA